MPGVCGAIKNLRRATADRNARFLESGVGGARQKRIVVSMICRRASRFYAKLMPRKRSSCDETIATGKKNLHKTVALELAHRHAFNSGGSGGLPRIMSEAFSAIINTQALMCAETRSGMTEASTTRRRSTPR